MPFNNHVKKLTPYFGAFNISTIAEQDTDPRKVDVSLASYRTEMGLPYVLPVVKEVEIIMANDLEADHEELSPLGLSSFRKAATQLVLGKYFHSISASQVLTIQTLSATGAMGLISEIARKNLKLKEVYLPFSVEERIKTIIEAAGFPQPKTFRYYDYQRHQLDLEGMLEDLKIIPQDSFIIFQACCHEPTGCDPSKKQWQQIAECIKGRLFPVFDLSCQGLATGDPDEDAFPIRLFARLGIEMAVAVSFANNFLLYNDRIGAAIFLLRHKEDIAPLVSHLGTMIIGQYGSPPYHGAKIVAMIVNNPQLYEKWLDSLAELITQMKKNRHDFVTALKESEAPGNWDYIEKGVGTLILTNLTDRQVQHLILYHHVYVQQKGVINVYGLNHNNVEYVANAIAETIKEFPRINGADYDQ